MVSIFLSKFWLFYMFKFTYLSYVFFKKFILEDFLARLVNCLEKGEGGLLMGVGL